MEDLNGLVQLRIYVSSTDKISEGLLYEFLVIEAKRHGMAGATAIKGIMGFGASSVIHSYRFWEIADKVPVVVEMVDEESKILSFWEKVRNRLETMRNGCLVTISPVTALLYRAGRSKAEQ